MVFSISKYAGKQANLSGSEPVSWSVGSNLCIATSSSTTQVYTRFLQNRDFGFKTTTTYSDYSKLFFNNGDSRDDQITGIAFRYAPSASADSKWYTYEVRLGLGSNYGSSQYPSGSWGTSASNVTVGSSSTLWGRTYIFPSDLESSGTSGFRLQVKGRYEGSNLTGSGYIQGLSANASVRPMATVYFRRGALTVSSSTTSATNITHNSADLRCTVSSNVGDNNSYDEITVYWYYRKGTSGSFTYLGRNYYTNGGIKTRTLTGLDPESTYQFYIRYKFWSSDLTNSDDYHGFTSSEISSSTLSFTTEPLPYAIYYNYDGTFKKVNDIYYNVDGTFKKVNQIWYNVGGTTGWKRTF
jgi:hypothetical protein